MWGEGGGKAVCCGGGGGEGWGGCQWAGGPRAVGANIITNPPLVCQRIAPAAAASRPCACGREPAAPRGSPGQSRSRRCPRPGPAHRSRQSAPRSRRAAAASFGSPCPPPRGDLRRRQQTTGEGPVKADGGERCPPPQGWDARRRAPSPAPAADWAAAGGARVRFPPGPRGAPVAPVRGRWVRQGAPAHFFAAFCRRGAEFPPP